MPFSKAACNIDCLLLAVSLLISVSFWGSLSPSVSFYFAAGDAPPPLLFCFYLYSSSCMHACMPCMHACMHACMDVGCGEFVFDKFVQWGQLVVSFCWCLLLVCL